MGLFDFLRGRKATSATNASPTPGTVQQAVKPGVPASSPDFSNVRSGVTSTAPSPGVGGGSQGVAQQTPGSAGGPAAQPQTYTVKPGDTLSKIAKQFYGDANAYPQIFEANRPLLDDPDKIYPGQVLKIPVRP